jgi:hypothetical protein
MIYFVPWHSVLSSVFRRDVYFFDDILVLESYNPENITLRNHRYENPKSITASWLPALCQDSAETFMRPLIFHLVVL